VISLEAQAEGVDALQSALKTCAKNAANLQPLFVRFGRYMTGYSVPENFRKGGRPHSWPGVIRWGSPAEPLRDQGYLANSVAYVAHAQDLELHAGSDKIRYARLMQEGGTILPKKKYLAIPVYPALTMSEARTTWARDWIGRGTWIMRGPEGLGVYRKAAVASSRITNKAGTKRLKKGKTQYAAGVQMIFRFVKKVTIKPRPYLMFQEEDLAALGVALGPWLFENKAVAIGKTA
jgi:phage gpG-like protein